MSKNIGKRLRFEIFKRDGFACRYCGARPPSVQLQIEHVVARSRGGTNQPENLVTSCVACNQGKSDKHLDESAFSIRLLGEEILLWEYRDEAGQFVATHRNRLLMVWPIRGNEQSIRWRWSVAEHVPDSEWWNGIADGTAGTRGAAQDLAELHRDNQPVMTEQRS